MNEGQAHICSDIDEPRRVLGCFQGSWLIGGPAAEAKSAADEEETKNGNETPAEAAL